MGHRVGFRKPKTDVTQLLDERVHGRHFVSKCEVDTMLEQHGMIMTTISRDI